MELGIGETVFPKSEKYWRNDMTVEEILNGESKEVEYKEMVPANSKKYTKTAVAYANCAGGII